MNDDNGLKQNLYPWLPNENILQVFDWQSIFNNNNPIEIDLGAGDGGFILELAKKKLEVNFVAVERLLGRIRKIAKRCVRDNYKNLRVLRLESSYFLKRMCPKNSLDVIHVMFPDPWPKRKHFKNRLIQGDFIEAAHDALKIGGILKFTTDHEGYFLWGKRIWKEFEEKDLWENLGEWDYAHDPITDFQKTFDLEGRKTYRVSWKKCA